MGMVEITNTTKRCFFRRKHENFSLEELLHNTCKEIELKLLNGDAIGSCQLVTPQQFRLLKFFLSSEDRSSGNFTDEYINNLKEVYFSDQLIENNEPEEASIREVDQWHLNKLTTKNFGGINAHDQEKFVFFFDKKGYVFQGDNGHGKTSLASAIIWAVTGKAINGDREPDTSANHPQLVKDLSANPEKLPHWPPVCSYPSTPQNWLQSSPNTLVSLEFANGKGNCFVLERELLPSGETKFHCEKDLNQIGISDLLIETCLLMPNKIAHIRLGENQDIVSAIIKLIGLQPLVDLADHIENLCHGNKNFSRDPKQSDIDKVKQRVDYHVGKAKELLEEIEADVSGLSLDGVKDEELEEYLSTLQAEYEKEANDYLEKIKAYISNEINIENGSDKKRLSNSIAALNTLVDNENSFLEVTAVRSLDVLCSEENKQLLLELQALALGSLDTLQQADYIRLKQQEDQKLKLKAFAAEYHSDIHGNDFPVEDCPLCERKFDTADLQELSKEISELKSQAELTKKTFLETCNNLCSGIMEQIGSIQQASTGIPNIGLIKNWFDNSLKSELTTNSNLAYVLPNLTKEKSEELSELIGEIANDQKETTDARLSESFSEEANKLIKYCRRIFSLLDTQSWWEANKEQCNAAWKTIMGSRQDEGDDKTIVGVIKVVSEAVDRAKPYQNAAEQILQASKDAKHWYALAKDREDRQSIRDAILPLKELRPYVEKQVIETLNALSENASEIFDKIYLPTSLGFSKATFGKKKTISIKGVVNNIAEIDATLIANTSWLQAVLWSFWLSLRSSVISQNGYNPFPLVVLDDPQATFDFHHARSWAREFGNMSRAEPFSNSYSQMIITTYDKRFVDDLELHSEFQGGFAYLNRNNKLTVIDGNTVQRAWNICDKTKHPVEAQKFIDVVRVQYEATLKILLRGYYPDVETANLGKMAQQILVLAGKGIQPFNIPNIINLAKDLNNKKLSAIDSSDLAHHDGREKLNYSEALEVKRFYDQMHDKFKKVLNVHRDHTAWISQGNISAKNVIEEQTLNTVNE